MAHQRHTYGFTGEDGAFHREDRFSPQNEADYVRLARIAAAETAGTDLLLDVRDIELYAHVGRDAQRPGECFASLDSVQAA